MLLALGGLAVSAVFLWLAVRNANLDEVRDVLSEARLGIVLLAVAVIGTAYLFQAARWMSIAAVPGLGLGRFYAMLLAGLACNNVLPVRIGELVRSGWLSRDGHIPGGRAFGTVVLDRVCDVVALVAFLVIGLQVVPTPDWLRRLAVGALLAVVAIVAVLVFARVYTRSRSESRHARGRVRTLVRDTVDMLAEPIGRRRAAVWLAFSAAVWGLSALASLLVARSLGIELGYLEAVFVTAVLALGVAIPSSPGYIGTYQLLGVEALGLLDVPVNEALAFSILMQASWLVPTTLAGGSIIGWRALKMR